MLVEFIRLSLYDRAIQGNLFEALEIDPTIEVTRETWLRTVFSQQIVFTHRAVSFNFVPDDSIASPPFIVGRIGRELVVRDNLPPEQGLQERIHEEWKASITIIDPTQHIDGQKMMMQVRGEIGKCVPIIQSLVEHLNKHNTVRLPTTSGNGRDGNG